MATTKKEKTTKLNDTDLRYLWNLCVADAGSQRDYGRFEESHQADEVAYKIRMLIERS